ncbi:MAG: hypothetical protein Q8Q29_04790 [Actinomycetota bacterium]|jgi:hypothetical protein|nr:hypothetical protein [Actinomycetota bacterium]
MSDTISVRDHSRPCEHGSLWPHWIHPVKARWWQEPDCLGGREMTLRRLREGVWMEVGEEGDGKAQ